VRDLGPCLHVVEVGVPVQLGAEPLGLRPHLRGCVAAGVGGGTGHGLVGRADSGDPEYGGAGARAAWPGPSLRRPAKIVAGPVSVVSWRPGGDRELTMTHAWTERDVEALLRASGYSEEWHVRRIVQSALALPPAAGAERLVDLGTHPAVLNV